MTVYYDALEIKKEATEQEVLSAYRAQALRHHPQRNPGVDTNKFQQLTEAYLILSSPDFKAAYDRFGESGLRHLATQQQGGANKLVFDGQSFCNLQKALQTFEDIFSTTDPFAAEFDSGISTFGAAPGMDETKWRPRPERKKKDDDMYVDLNLNLEELYFGCTKKRKITRRVINADNTFVSKEEIIEIIIKPGFKNATEIRFKELGDEAPGVIPSDIVFVIKENQHDIFKRDGDNLIVNLKISLLQALGGFTAEVKTLDGRALHAEINEIVQPGSQKIVHGEGMPQFGSSKKGNLLIQFDVVFPKHIPDHQKKILKEVLKECQ